jgi:hypothetical protein
VGSKRSSNIKAVKAKKLTKDEKERRHVAKHSNDKTWLCKCDMIGCKLKYTALASLNRHHSRDKHGEPMIAACNPDASKIEHRNHLKCRHPKHELKALGGAYQTCQCSESASAFGFTVAKVLIISNSETGKH